MKTIAIDEVVKIDGILKKPLSDLLKSKVYYALFKRFRGESIEIPFPQRDINLGLAGRKLVKTMFNIKLIFIIKI